MKKLSTLLITLLFLGAYSANAQQASISNVLKLRSAKQTGEIVENNKIVGYFVFYFKEKEDRKTSTYEIELFDDNYNSVKNVEITRSKNSYLMEMVYNGEVFMLFFYDRKTGYEFLTLNRSGEEVGSKIIPVKEISNFDIQKSVGGISSESENVTIYPLGNSGFVRQTYTKNKKMGYELVAYDNQLNELWTVGSPADSKLIQTAEISEVSEGLITVTIYRKKSLMTKKFDVAFLMLDAKTGDLVKEISMGSAEEGKQSVLRTYFDEASSKVILIGEFFKPGDDIMKDKSKGLFVTELDEKGEEITSREYAWKGEIDQFKNDNLSDEDKKNSKDAFSIFFHNVIRSADGHLFLIGEQFKKQISAGGVAMNVLAGATGGQSDAASFEIRVSNMIVIELDEKIEMVDYKVIPKKNTSVYLQKGMGLYGSAFLGYYIKSLGGFDYSFTSSDKDNDKYSIIYQDFDRKEEKGAKKSDVMLGVIQIDAGKLEASRVAFNTDAKRFWFQAATPGNISVVEYYRKEKRIDMRIEKLVY